MSEGITVEYLKRKDTVLARMLNTIYDAVYIVDKDRRILFWNKAAEKMTGYAAQNVEGISCADNVLNHIDQNGRLLCKTACPLVHCMTHNVSVEEKVYPLHQSGRRFPVQTHVAPILNERGEVIAGIEVFRDISHEEDFRILQEKFNTLIKRYVSTATMDEVLAQLDGSEKGEPRLRDLTVMYLDVVGFTAFSEKHSPDETVALLNDVFGMSEVITTEFHGDVDKFMGDCVMAVFIDANDAVAAAEQILDALGRYNELREKNGQVAVGVRIGVNSGRVIQGDVGMRERKDLTVIGDVVNTAARVEELAAPNTVLITESTRARLERAERFVLVKETEVQGRAEPVRVYAPNSAG